MRHEALGLFLEAPVGDLPDLVPGGEHPVCAGHDHAARLGARGRGGELGERRDDRVEDGMVERVALGGVGDRQAGDVLCRPVDQQLAAGELVRGGAGGHGGRLACVDDTPVGSAKALRRLPLPSGNTKRPEPGERIGCI